MDHPNRYPSSSQQQQHQQQQQQQQQQRLFQSQQLPPPHQLPSYAASFSRSNVLPPISQLPQNTRYPPPSYSHPSLSNTAPAPVLPGSSQLPFPTHRTSNSRDEHSQISPPLRHSDSRSSFRDRVESPRDAHHRQQPPQQESPMMKQEVDDNMPATSDFVKKLYKMLEDKTFAHVVCWGPQGDNFVVKDMNEFTKTILPRMFKHSNFASFVRQLNKYDFHKVKNTDDNQYGEHSWTFKHPDFHADRRDALENIKRKVPAARKSTGGPSAAAAAARGANSPSPSASNANVEAIQAQMDRMQRTQDEMAVHIRNLESNYQNVLSEMVNFQRNMAQQDGLMQNLIQYFLQLENGRTKVEQLSSQAAQQAALASDPNPFLPATEAQRIMGGAYPDADDLARASLAQMNEISRRAAVAGMTFSTEPQAPPQQQQQNGMNGASNSGNVNGQRVSVNGDGQPSSSMGRIIEAAAGLLQPEDAPVRPMSRQDALARIEELTRNRPASAQGLSTVPVPAPDIGPSNTAYENETFGHILNPIEPPPQAPGSADPDSDLARYGVQMNPTTLTHEGLQVFTVGHLMPKSSIEDANGNWSFDPNSLNAMVMPTPQGMGGDPPQEDERQSQHPLSIAELTSPTPTPGPASSRNGAGSNAPGRPGSAQMLRVRRSTYVPGWAVPPRVLLVDDDVVSRKLSSKFLQIFGCTIDVAVDGVAAVERMNLERYDLVLMDIVMPKLDGVSATSLIRRFDHMTPIISMTSNSRPAEILKYYSSGMNDILPKPFTKDGLFDMLEKHLMHLKVIQTMTKVPRSVGVPPLSDASFDQALVMQASTMASNAASSSTLDSNTSTAQGSTSSSTPATLSAPSPNFSFPLALGDDDGKINPLAGMGLTDEQYSMILQNLVSGENFMGIGSSLDAMSMGAMGVGMGMMGGMTMAMSGMPGMQYGDGMKRGLDDPSDGRDGKRGRFEVIE
ncbi:hypothetical protein QCA50_003671 [Cerrena zonata]|uniref:Response regulatory domain-containing protein n=1 Tax=Cerrena zonata TaxID=2478898 RepID=A0AAW0GLJ1_9APHY